MKKHRRLHIDFSALQSISAATALILAAELDRWRTLFRFRPTVKVEEWSPSVRALLHEMGLFTLLDASNKGAIDALSEERNEKTTNFIKFESGENVDGILAIKLRENIETATSSEVEPKRRRLLFRGVSEAMTNVIKHAYPAGLRTEVLSIGRWWMAGSYDQRRRRLRVAFFDQGVGIPRTLPRKYAIEKISGFLVSAGLIDDDASRIRAAMELGATQSGNPYQGKGLRNIRQFVELSPDGTLLILSQRGRYVYSPKGGVSLRTHGTALGGTLIQWEVSV